MTRHQYNSDDDNDKDIKKWCCLNYNKQSSYAKYYSNTIILISLCILVFWMPLRPLTG